MTLTIRTAKAYSRYQVVVVVLFAVLIPYFMWRLYSQGGFDSEPVAIGILAVGFGFFYWRWLIGLAVAWFTDAFVVEIDENRIRYRNLFGRQGEIDVSDIRKVHNIRVGFNGFAFITNGGVRFAPNTNIDYLTFLYDYIFERLDSECEYDHELLNKLRRNPAYWAYQRHISHGADYSVDEIQVLTDHVRSQYSDLVATGILNRDIPLQ